MTDFSQIPTKEIQKSTAEALTNNGFSTHIAKGREDAKKIALALLPEKAEVMTATSVTLDVLGIPEIIDSSGKFNSVKNKLSSMDRKRDHAEMQRLGASPEYVMGSVHALTQDGHVLVASNTGSQLPSYSYGASHVIWIVGAQKIVKDISEGEKRINEYTLPLETKRARKAYNLPETYHSNVSKLLILNKEITEDRITIIIVPEVIGY